VRLRAIECGDPNPLHQPPDLTLTEPPGKCLTGLVVGSGAGNSASGTDRDSVAVPTMAPDWQSSTTRHMNCRLRRDASSPAPARSIARRSLRSNDAASSLVSVSCERRRPETVGVVSFCV